MVRETVAARVSPTSPAPPRRVLRPHPPMRNRVARVGVGRAYQAVVQAWPHGDSPTAPEAARTSFERGDMHIHPT